MAVGAHDQQVSFEIAGARQQHIAGSDPARGGGLDLRLDAMPGKVQRDIGAGQFAMSGGARPRIDDQDRDGLRCNVGGDSASTVWPGPPLRRARLRR